MVKNSNSTKTFTVKNQSPYPWSSVPQCPFPWGHCQMWSSINSLWHDWTTIFKCIDSHSFSSPIKPYHTLCSPPFFFLYFIYLRDDFILTLRDCSVFPRPIWNPRLQSWALSALSLLDGFLSCSYPDLIQTLHAKTSWLRRRIDSLVLFRSTMKSPLLSSGPFQWWIGDSQICA